MNRGKTTSLNWLFGILTAAVLFSTRPVLETEHWALWVLLAGLMALVLNFDIAFQEGSISAAHTVGLMTYLILATDDQFASALWSVAVGSLLGHIVYQRRLHRWRGLSYFVSQHSGAILVGTAQQTLGLLVANFAYRALGGQLPLRDLSAADELPIAAFVSAFLAVYLTILIVDARDQKPIWARRMVTQNWQILVAVLVFPVPFAILGPVVRAQISEPAFGLLIAGLLMMVYGVYSLSHTQQKYQQQVQELSALSGVSRALRTQLDLSTLLQTVYLQVAHLLNVHNVTIALYDPARQLIEFPVNIWAQQPLPRPSRPKENQLIDYVIDTQASLLIRDNVSDSAKALNLQPPGGLMYSWLAVPLLATDRAFGCIVVISSHPDRFFSEGEQRLLTAIAAQASVAIENAQLYERTRNHVSQLKALTVATGELGRTLAPTRVLDTICHNAPSVAGAQAASVFLFWDRQNLAFVNSVGFPRESYFDRAPIMPLLVENQSTIPVNAPPTIVMDTHLDHRAERFRASFDSYKKRAFVEMVLHHPEKDELFGILVVYFDNPTFVDNALVDTIQTYADQASLSISNSQLYSHTEAILARRVGQLSALADTGRDLTTVRDLPALFNLVLDRAVKGTSSSVGGLVIADEEHGIKKPKMITAQGQDAFSFQNVPVIKQVYETGKPILLGDIGGSNQHFRISPKAQAQMSIPVLHNQKPIGVLILEHNSQDSFSEDDITFITQLLSQVGIAIDNIQLVNRLAEERDRLQVLLDSMTEAIILIDGEGVIALANPCVETLLNLPKTITGKSVISLLHDPEIHLAEALGFEREALELAVKELQEGSWTKPEARKDYQLFEPDTRHIHRNEAPVSDTTGKTIGMLMVFTDITEEQELKRTQEEISSMIVHDLRSPLTAVTASLRLLRELANPDDSFGKVVFQTTEVSNRAIRKLLNLINSLLDISKMETGIISLDREPYSIKAMAQHVITELEPLAVEMEVGLANEVDEAAPLVNIDTDKMERVIYNLVDNAIKFTPGDGRVYLRTATAQNIPEGFIAVEVCDTGPGIPDQYKQSLFNRFEQVKGRRGRRRGTGLGLTFCKLTVEAHGGNIWVEDNPTGGSKFVFTLPLVLENVLED